MAASSKRIVLGVDPGLATTGYAFIQCENQNIQLIAAGVVRTVSEQPFAMRLRQTFDEISRLIDQYHPAELAIESLFYAQNARAAIEMGHARGVVILSAVKRNLPVVEYAAREVKQAVVGYGNASKQQVQRMVKELLQLEELPKPFDKADAIAIALCHVLRTK